MHARETIGAAARHPQFPRPCGRLGSRTHGPGKLLLPLQDNLVYAAPKISQVGKEMHLHGFTDEDAGVAVQVGSGHHSLVFCAALRARCPAKVLLASHSPTNSRHNPAFPRVQKAHEVLERAEQEDEAAAARRERVVMSVEVPYRERERWDCESVLSMRSNLDNHPGRISEPSRLPRPRRGGNEAGPGPRTLGAIRLDSKGIPMGVLPPRLAAAAAAAAAGAGDAQAAADGDSGGGSSGGEEVEAAGGGAPLERHKGETAEEKKARKEAVKQAKRGARVNKKELKEMFKHEKVKAQHRAATAQPQAAIKLPS